MLNINYTVFYFHTDLLTKLCKSSQQFPSFSVRQNVVWQRCGDCFEREKGLWGGLAWGLLQKGKTVMAAFSVFLTSENQI